MFNRQFLQPCHLGHSSSYNQWSQLDIRSFFRGASSSKTPDYSSSTSDTEDKIDGNQSAIEYLEPSPAKKDQ